MTAAKLKMSGPNLACLPWAIGALARLSKNRTESSYPFRRQRG